MFPQFNINSTPLLILVIQGLIFAFLLFRRYFRERADSDLLIALILLIMAYHRTTYTIGFMGWYDTFQNTKINYYLISFSFAIGPLIYLYVRTVISPPFKVKRVDLWHFLPVLIFVLYRLILLIHDAGQPDWETGFEGQWQREIHLAYIAPISTLLTYTSQVVYYAFTIQLFWQYRLKIKEYFSDTQSVALEWIRNFLIIYTFLFVYEYLTDLIDAFIEPLDYINKWWVHLFSAIAIVYLGIKSYFTDLKELHAMTFEMAPSGSSPETLATGIDTEAVEKLEAYMREKASYLHPNLTLRDIATGMKWNIQEVSSVINSGSGKNFNEWVNEYRVEEVKAKLKDSSNDHLSLVAIAFDSGFNSKATFNRVFKSITGLSPSDYKARSRS